MPKRTAHSTFAIQTEMELSVSLLQTYQSVDFDYRHDRNRESMQTDLM